jgi:hypothetical protein
MMTTCNCCFTEISDEFILSCDTSISHSFCFECVSGYLLSSAKEERIKLKCLLKRACSGYLSYDGIVKYLTSTRDIFANVMSKDTMKERVGTIVNCFKCDKFIRKLAFYNYVSCECGTVVCYACEQDITDKTRRHLCGPTNKRREPLWVCSEDLDSEPIYVTSRRYSAYSNSGIRHAQRIDGS